MYTGSPVTFLQKRIFPTNLILSPWLADQIAFLMRTTVITFSVEHQRGAGRGGNETELVKSERNSIDHGNFIHTLYYIIPDQLSQYFLSFINVFIVLWYIPFSKVINDNQQSFFNVYFMMLSSLSNYEDEYFFLDSTTRYKFKKAGVITESSHQ